MKFTNTQKAQLEEECFDLERETNVQDELNEENVEEATLDYANKVAKSETLVQKALENNKTLTQFIRTENKIFNAKLFAEKLVTVHNPAANVDPGENDDHMNDSNDSVKRGLDLEHFNQLGRQFSSMINQTPVFHFTYGSFVPEIDIKALIKERKKPNRINDFNTETTLKPTDYDEAKTQNDDVVTDEIEHLLDDISQKVKKKKRSIDFYEAIIDKDSLTSSVTNIFHSAFMVKEGMLHLEMKNGKNLVRPTNEDESSRKTSQTRRQQVLRFNKAKFDNWCLQQNGF